MKTDLTTLQPCMVLAVLEAGGHGGLTQALAQEDIKDTKVHRHLLESLIV